MLIGNQSQTAKSDKDLWTTPVNIFRGIERFLNYKFDLDAAAILHNTKCTEFISEEMDCLKTDWGIGKKIWLNPPYSNPLPFVEKAIEQSNQNYNTVVMLLPADTSVKWFKQCQLHADWIYFITQGRINFINNGTGEKGKSGNSKGSMLVIFDRRKSPHSKCRTKYVDLSTLISLGGEG